jgi:hypothetical protein
MAKSRARPYYTLVVRKLPARETRRARLIREAREACSAVLLGRVYVSELPAERDDDGPPPLILT